MHWLLKAQHLVMKGFLISSRTSSGEEEVCMHASTSVGKPDLSGHLLLALGRRAVGTQRRKRSFVASGHSRPLRAQRASSVSASGHLSHASGRTEMGMLRPRPPILAPEFAQVSDQDVNREEKWRCESLLRPVIQAVSAVRGRLSCLGPARS